MSEEQPSQYVFHRMIDQLPHVAIIESGEEVDLGDQRRNWMIQVSLALTDIAEDKQPNDAEADRLDAMTEVLVPAVCTAHDAVFAGILTGGAARQWYFLATKPQNVEATLKKAIPTSTFTVSSCEDRTRDRLLETLYPTAEEVRWNADMMVLLELEEAGDDMSTEREFEHAAIFENQEAADHFAEWATEAGFLKVTTRQADDGIEVGFVHIGVPEIEDIFERTLDAMFAAEDREGEYDGWWTNVHPEAE